MASPVRPKPSRARRANLGVLLLVTVFVIYIILGILYESFVHPITILTGLPFATFGALLALFVTRVELDVYAYVGIIMLIGIVKKNAIMMIDFAIAAERAGHTTPSSDPASASVRFRPIDGRPWRPSQARSRSHRHRRHGRVASPTRRDRRRRARLLTDRHAVRDAGFYTYLDELQGWMARKFFAPSGCRAGIRRPIWRARPTRRWATDAPPPAVRRSPSTVRARARRVGHRPPSPASVS